MGVNYMEVIEDLEARRDQIDSAIEAIRQTFNGAKDSPLKGVEAPKKRKYRKRNPETGELE